jgi:hypothetical protein
MENLKLDKFQNKKLENLKGLIGCGNGTTYTGSQGSSGTDTYEDENGNDEYNDGECVRLDDGRSVDC